MSLVYYFLVYFYKVERDWERLGDVYCWVNIFFFGCGVLVGIIFFIDRYYIVELLGFEKFYVNSLDGVSDRDFVIEFFCVVSIIMVYLSCLVEEIIVWLFEEFRFVILIDVCFIGSSIMF